MSSFNLHVAQTKAENDSWNPWTWDVCQVYAQIGANGEATNDTDGHLHTSVSRTKSSVNARNLTLAQTVMSKPIQLFTALSCIILQIT
jgi:hypothetical protein